MPLKQGNFGSSATGGSLAKDSRSVVHSSLHRVWGKEDELVLQGLTVFCTATLERDLAQPNAHSPIYNSKHCAMSAAQIPLALPRDSLGLTEVAGCAFKSLVQAILDQESGQERGAVRKN